MYTICYCCYILFLFSWLSFPGWAKFSKRVLSGIIGAGIFIGGKPFPLPNQLCQGISSVHNICLLHMPLLSLNRVATNLEYSEILLNMLMEFSGNSVLFQGELTLCSGCSLCQAIHMQPSVSGALKLLIWAIWDDRLLLVTWVVVDVEWPVIYELMKVIITYIFGCDNLCKSIIMALEKPGKLREFFLLLCGHNYV